MNYLLRSLLFVGIAMGIGCASISNDSSGGGSGGSGGRASLTGGAAMAGTGGHATGGAGPVIEPDGGVIVAEDAAGCTHLNIGILGNPGANASSNFQQWLQDRGTTVQRIQTATGVPLTADALKPFDVVLLDWLPRDYTADEASVFAAWVAAGGGVVALTGYHDNTSEDWRANSLLAPLGVAFSGSLLWGPVMQFDAHPITMGLTSVTFTGGYGISDLGTGASTGMPVGYVSANGTKTPVAYVLQMGAGKAFLWGDEWIEFDSEWSSTPQIPKLWLQIFSWLAPGDRCALTGIG